MMELNRIHNMPCAEMFAGLTEQAALVIADPPYGIGYKSHEKRRIGSYRGGIKKFVVREELEDFGDSSIDTNWICDAYNILKMGGAMYLFTRWDVLHTWHTAAQDAGFKIAQCIVWDKALWGAGDLSFYGSQTENILVCVKGKHNLRWAKREGNMWRIAKAGVFRDGGGKHPTQKPTQLFRKIIQYSSDMNDLIVDPFTGSGAACIAAQRLHRRFVGCDISPTFAQSAQQWLEDDARQNAQVRMMPMF